MPSRCFLQDAAAFRDELVSIAVRSSERWAARKFLEEQGHETTESDDKRQAVSHTTLFGPALLPSFPAAELNTSSQDTSFLVVVSYPSPQEISSKTPVHSLHGEPARVLFSMKIQFMRFNSVGPVLHILLPASGTAALLLLAEC
eukprot:755827-Hanusia_phi.AAC.1